MKKFKASSVLVSVLATGIVLLSGCDKEDEVNNIITNNITIEDVLSSQDSDLNQSLSALNYSDDLSDYSDARTKKSISSCSHALSNLGKKLLESSVCTLLDIDVENVVDFQVSWNDKSNGTVSDAVNATITYITPTSIAPVIAPPIPASIAPVASGVINANELPRYTGDLPFVHTI